LDESFPEQENNKNTAESLSNNLFIVQKYTSEPAMAGSV
jgi:hypothetical protein